MKLQFELMDVSHLALAARSSIILFGGHETQEHGILCVEWGEVVEEFHLTFKVFVDLRLRFSAVMAKYLEESHRWAIVRDIVRLSGLAVAFLCSRRCVLLGLFDLLSIFLS